MYFQSEHQKNTSANNRCVDCKDYQQLLENIKEKINTVSKKTNSPFNISTRQLDTVNNCILVLGKATSLKKKQGIIA